MNPTQLSHQLRQETTPDLHRRRWIIGLSMVGTVAAQAVSLYQTGIIKHLPDPPIPLFDSDKVDASDYAYRRADTPDGLLMLVSYGLTALLAGAGGKDRADTHPALPVAMGVKTVTDTALALQLAREEWQDNKALCTYCQAATLASAVSVVLAVPEVVRAIKNWFRK